MKQQTKPGYESSTWREFLKSHDDIETYCPIKCENCRKERPYCYCEHPKFERQKA